MKIEKGIPMPTTPSRTQRPFAFMEVGDSVLIQDPADFTKAHNAAKQTGHRQGKGFTARREAGGLRIWRIR